MVEVRLSNADYTKEAVRGAVERAQREEIERIKAKTPSERTASERKVLEDYEAGGEKVSVYDALSVSAERRTALEQKLVDDYLRELYGEDQVSGERLEVSEDKSDVSDGGRASEPGARMAEAEAGLVSAFEGREDMVADVHDDAWSVLGEPDLTGAQRGAVLDYINALDGVDVSAAEAEAIAVTRRRTHRQSGKVIAATTAKGEQVFLVSGNVRMYSDGKGVDRLNSDSFVVVCDGRGHYRMMSPEMLSSVGEGVDAAEYGARRAAVTEGQVSGPATGSRVNEPGAQVSGERLEVREDKSDVSDHSDRSDVSDGGRASDTPNRADKPDRAETEAEESAERPRLSAEKDAHGHEFVVARDGGTTFGYIDADSGLTEAPICLSVGENYVGDDGRNHGYGLLHIEAEHGAQIRESGWGSVEEFVEDVARNYDTIREGNEIAGNQTYLLEVSDVHNNTLFVQLSNDGRYWNVNSAGIFRKKYSRRKPEVKSLPTIGSSSIAEAAEVNHGQSNGETVTSENSSLTSAGKGSESLADVQADEVRGERLEVREAQADRGNAAVGANEVGAQIRERWDAAPKVAGNADVLTLADGLNIRGRYVLTEAGAASASHDVNNAYAPTEGFPVDENGQSVNDRDYLRDRDAQRIVGQMADNYDSRALQTPVVVSADGVVLSGNNRTMSGDIAARQGTDKAYKEYLSEFGQKYGFTREQVEGMEHPRVVFVPDEAMPYNARTFALFNAESQKKQGKAEQAVKLGKIVPEEVFGAIVEDLEGYDKLADYFANDRATSRALGLLMDAGVINDKQLPELRTGTSLSASGRELLENVLVGKIFQEDPDAVRKIIDVPSMRQAIVMAMNEVSSNRMLSSTGYDLTDELSAAVDLVYQAKRSLPEVYKQGKAVSGFGRQQGMFDDEYGDSVVRDGTVLLLADVLNSAKPGDLRRVLATYNRDAREASAGQLDIFSGEAHSKEEILSEVIKFFKNATRREQDAHVGAAIAERKRSAEQRGKQVGAAVEGGEGESGGNNEERQDNLQKIVEVTGAERTEMASRIVDWLSDENLSKAFGKTREEIFDEFGNALEPIAYVPLQFVQIVSPMLTDPRIYCGKGYFIDHALRNHGGSGHQIAVEDVDVSKYLNIQAVLDNPDYIKETSVDGKRTIVFIKKIGRYFAELTQVEEGGKIVLHKSLFDQKKEPYAKLNDIRQKVTSSEGGDSSISHAENSAPAISLQSRGDVVSSEKDEHIDMSPISAGKGSTLSADTQAGEPKDGSLEADTPNKAAKSDVSDHSDVSADKADEVGETGNALVDEVAAMEAAEAEATSRNDMVRSRELRDRLYARLGELSDAELEEVAEFSSYAKAVLSIRRQEMSDSDVLLSRASDEDVVAGSDVRIKPKRKKFVMHSLCGDKSAPAAMGGVYHDGEHGVAVATDAHVMIVSRKDYDASLAGKVVDKKGNELATGYLGYERVVPAENSPVSVDYDDLLSFVTGALDVEKNPGAYGFDVSKSAAVIIRFGDGRVGYYDLKLLEKFVRGAQHLGVQTIDLTMPVSRSAELLSARNEAGVVVLISKVPGDIRHVSPFVYDVDKVREAQAADKPNRADKAGDAGIRYRDGGEEYPLRWSEERAGNGEPFLIGEGGSIDLVDIPQEVLEKMGVKNAPFRLTPSMVRHVYERHKQELKLSSPEDAVSAILDVMRNFDHVRKGEGKTFVFSIEDARRASARRAVTIVLEYDKGKWLGIKTVGYDRMANIKELTTLWEKGEGESSATGVVPANVASAQPLQDDRAVGIASNQRGVKSGGKGTTLSSDVQTGEVSGERLAVPATESQVRGERLAVREDMPDEGDMLEVAKALAARYGLNAEDVLGYAEAMRRGDMLKANYAKSRIREQVIGGERLPLSERSKRFAPVKRELYECFGSVEDLIEARREEARREESERAAERARVEAQERAAQERMAMLEGLSDSERDARYLSAIERGDETAARELLDAAARSRGYVDTESAYQGVGAWSAPSDPGFSSARERRESIAENGGEANLEDISMGYSPVDDEMFYHPERMGFGDASAREAGAALSAAIDALRRGGKDVRVRVYRAVPAVVREGKLRNGDWVTPSKLYAREHGENRLRGDYRIIEDVVPASQLWFDGNDVREWGFDDGNGYRYRNVRNNRKLNDLVTRDDDGNIIPPSRRFDSRKGDVRYRTSEQLSKEYGGRWLDEQTNDDGRHTTQVSNTLSSYRKFGEWVKRDSGGRAVSVLDASSGLGLGTEWLRDNGIEVEDVEPYPSENRVSPTYRSYDDIDKRYDYIISNAVLNVIPDDWRADLLHNMASKLKVGGRMVINVRGAESIRRQGKEGVTRITLDDPTEILVLRPNGTIKAYQKGFTRQELKGWCERELGADYSVEIANEENAGGKYDTAVVVTKNNESGTIGVASGDSHPSRNAQALPNSDAKLGINSEAAKYLDEISANLGQKGMGSHEFLYEMAKAFGLNGDSLKGSYYCDLGDSIGLRISDHSASTANIVDRNGNDEVYGLVVKLSGHRFRKNDAANYLEYVYYPDRLDAERQKSIVSGLKGFLETGDYGRLPIPDRVNRSGKFKADNQVPATGGRVNDTPNRADMPDRADSSEAAKAERVEELARKLGARVRIVRTEAEIADLENRRQRRAKGWYDTTTGDVVVVLPNNADVADVENTMLHEIVGHDGLRVLFPDEEKLNNALDELYRVSDAGIRAKIDGMAQKMYEAEVERLQEQMRKEHEALGEDASASYYADMAKAKAEAHRKRERFRREATEEYAAEVAGRVGDEGFERMSAQERTFWGRLRGMLERALRRLLEGLKIRTLRKWGDREWAYVLHEAYKRKRNGGRPTVFDRADTALMRYKVNGGAAAEVRGERLEVPATGSRASDRADRSDVSDVSDESDGGRMNDTPNRADMPNMPDKGERIEALRRSEPVEVSADMIPADVDIKDRKSVQKSLRETIRGKYVNEHDGRILEVSGRGINEVTHHGMTDEAHVKSLFAIPEMLRKSIYMDSRRNEKDKNEFDEYRYYVCGLKIDGDDYTAKIVVGVKNGHSYYDHRLSHIEKGKLIDSLNAFSNGVADEKLPVTGYKGTTLESLLQAESGEKESEGGMIRYRDGDDMVSRERVYARALYEPVIRTSLYQVTEAFQDSMLGLKTLYKAVEGAAGGEGRDVTDIPDYENAYLAENRMSSIVLDKQQRFARDYMQPLTDAVARLARNRYGLRRVIDYMLAKHGLERNAYMRAEAEKNGEESERDFAGLTALTGCADYVSAEAAARAMVDGFEARKDASDVQALWDAVNAATESTLRSMYDGGIIDEQTYNDVRDMYDYYIPLRGFDERTSDEVYAYLEHRRGGGSDVMKKAKGRKSKADDPLVSIAGMAESAIVQSEKNKVKLCFLNYVLNHPSDLVSVSRLWLRYNDVTDEWEPVTAKIEPGDTAEEVAAKTAAFEQPRRAETNLW